MNRRCISLRLAAVALVFLPGAAGAADFSESTVPPAGQLPGASDTRVAVGGYLQADALLNDASSRDQVIPTGAEPLNTERFLIRRARLSVEVSRYALFSIVDWEAGTVKGFSLGLARAELGWRKSLGDAALQMDLGLVRIPFGAETMETDPSRLFLERSHVGRALFPGTYDLGARARVSWRFLSAWIAAMNGNPPGDATFPGRDPNAAKDMVGRIGIDTAIGGRIRCEAGFSSLSGKGFHVGALATKDVLFWRDQNEDGLVQQSEIQVIPGRAATPSANFSRFAVGADARITIEIPRMGPFVALGEVVWAANLDRGISPADPVSSGRDLREFGWLLGATQSLTKRGAVGVRYDFYNPDVDAYRQAPTVIVPKDSAFRTWTFTAAWRATGMDRLVLEFQRNRNALGLSANGTPTSLSANTLTLRGQMVF